MRGYCCVWVGVRLSTLVPPRARPRRAGERAFGWRVTRALRAGAGAGASGGRGMRAGAGPQREARAAAGGGAGREGEAGAPCGGGRGGGARGG
eukprot:1192971-Prymnesium_polylepis.1